MAGEDAIIGRLKAEEALSRIDRHEELCAERYEGIHTSQRELSKKLDEIKSSNFSQWLVVAGGVITILLSLVGLLFSKVMGWF